MAAAKPRLYRARRLCPESREGLRKPSLPCYSSRARRPSHNHARAHQAADASASQGQTSDSPGAPQRLKTAFANSTGASPSGLPLFSCALPFCPEAPRGKTQSKNHQLRRLILFLKLKEFKFQRTHQQQRARECGTDTVSVLLPVTGPTL